jgi:hypothetical protein
MTFKEFIQNNDYLVPLGLMGLIAGIVILIVILMGF